MKSIWKYELVNTDVQSVDMPLGAEILTVQMQNGKPHIWCLVNEKEEKAFRKIRIICTGESIKSHFTGKYIGSYQDGVYVFHLFDYGY